MLFRSHAMMRRVSLSLVIHHHSQASDGPTQVVWETIPSAETLSARAYQGLVYSTDIDVGGRTWTIVCLATSSIQSSTSTYGSALTVCPECAMF